MSYPAILLLFLLSLIVPSRYGITETIDLFTYHNHPPFVTEPGRGLTFDLAQELTKLAQGRYAFTVRVLPRSRLNLQLAPWIQNRCDQPKASCQNNWTVLWVNQAWGFGSAPEKNYRWVELFQDSNAIISLQEHQVDYKNPQSLIGYRFGGMRGHSYMGMETLFKEGKINRIDGNDERQNIFTLLMKRLDVILLPTSTIRYFLTKDKEISKFAQKIYIAPEKHQTYSRNFMVPLPRTDLEQFYKTAISSAVFQEMFLENNGR